MLPGPPEDSDEEEEDCLRRFEADKLERLAKAYAAAEELLLGRQEWTACPVKAHRDAHWALEKYKGDAQMWVLEGTDGWCLRQPDDAEADTQGTDAATIGQEAEFPEGALFVACFAGHVEAVRLLLGRRDSCQARVDIHKAACEDYVYSYQYYGSTPFSIACWCGHVEVVKLLLDKVGIPDEQSVQRVGAPQVVAGFDSERFRKSSIAALHAPGDDDGGGWEEGIDWGAVAGGGLPGDPLYQACNDGNVAVARLLLDQEGIDVNVAACRTGTRPGDTPLLAACTAGHVGIVKLLLQRGDIDVNKANARMCKQTPLHRVCGGSYYRINVEIAEMLLAHHNINVDNADTPNSAHASALWYVAARGNFRLAQLLMVHGADVSGPNNDFSSSPAGKIYAVRPLTAAERAYNCGHDTLSEWLYEVGGWSPLEIAAGCRLHNEAAIMLRQGQMDPDVFPPYRLLQAIDASKAEAAALPWRDALPICSATINVIYDATRGWTEETHWLYHANARRAVHTVLLVACRLETEYDQLYDVAEADAGDAAFDALPTVLPAEIWLHVMLFIQRSWWKV